MTSTIADPSQSEFLTVAEAAEELRVTEGFKLIATGDLSAVKVGSRPVRIRRTSLEDILRPVRTIPPHPRRR